MSKMRTLMIALLCLVAGTCMAQGEYLGYAIGFYNQENLFDTCHDEGKRDYDFLPTGSYKWNGLKYAHKLKNMARVLAEMGTDKIPGVGCAIIGLAEVENARVMDDLIAQEPLAERGYRYVHIEGPDRRGIDCALLYNPLLYTVESAVLHPYVQELEKDSAFFTRGFLTVKGQLAGEELHVIVCHLPSRASGSFYREQGARQLRAIKDSILHVNAQAKVIIMGDMNDDPTNKSIKDELRAKGEADQVGRDDMFNPMYNILAKDGRGTLMYDGAWNLFDQILLTPNMVNKSGKKDFTTLKYFNRQIFQRDYMFQTEGKYKGNPKRTHAGGIWLDGYSDHLPVVVYLAKQK